MPSWAADEIAGIDPGPGTPDASDHGPDREDVGLASHVAPLADHVAAEEVAGLVGDHSGELRLVAHPQEKAGKDDGEPGREHHRIELGDPGDINPHVTRGRSADLADEVAHVACDALVPNQQVGAGDLLLDPLDLLPQALLVLVGRPVGGADQRIHVGRANARLGHAGDRGGGQGAPTREQ